MASSTKSPERSGAQSQTVFAEGFAEAMEQGRAQVQAGLEAWTIEYQRLLEGMVADATIALEGLKTCKSPVDALAVEHAWLAARTKAYWDCGARLLSVAAPGAPAAPTGKGD